MIITKEISVYQGIKGQPHQGDDIYMKTWRSFFHQVDGGGRVRVRQENEQHVQSNEVRSWSVCGTTRGSTFLEHKVEKMNSQK